MRYAALLLCYIGCFCLAADLLPVPPLSARVQDYSNTLTQAQLAALDGRLSAFEARKGSQIAVLIVATTGSEAIEQYALRVAAQWKLGRKGIDDGALLLIALNDRRLRIEVGYGLEGALNDATAKRIISEIMLPHLRSNALYAAIDTGVSAMIGVIDGEPLPPPKAQAMPPVTQSLMEIGALALIGAAMLGAFLRLFFGRLIAATITGTIIGIGAWILAGFFLAGLLGALIGFLFTFTGGPWLGGGRPPGGGGGHFGGGGGTFGGGGASGKWR